MTNNNLQNIIQNTKDRASWPPLKTVDWSQVIRKGEQFLLHIVL
jgi:hypothetical protein